MRVAVIGAGTMGNHHARVYADMEDVELVGIADVNESAAAKLGHRHRATPYKDFRELLDREKPDLVSIAVPTRLHCEVACEVMGRGVHVLIEKPLAISNAEGRAIVEQAQRCGVNAMVGHIERFNPAVIEIKRRLADGALGRILQVHARRLSPYPGRIEDVGVVLDLATHDIDVIRYLIGSGVERAYAELASRSGSDCDDLLSALLRFDNGVIGVLDVNWLSPTKVRQLSVLGENGILVADYLTQDLYWYQNGAPTETWGTLAALRGVSEGDMIKIRLDKKEPIQLELREFVASVRENRPPTVPSDDALITLDLTTRLLESGRYHRPEPDGRPG